MRGLLPVRPQTRYTCVDPESQLRGHVPSDAPRQCWALRSLFSASMSAHTGHRVEFVVADGDEVDPDCVVAARFANPSPDQIRAALLTTLPIEYGAHFILNASGAGKLVAICTSGPFARPDEPGEFLLLVDDELVREGLTRPHSVLDAFLNALVSA
jgi:hypothetical protein